MTSAVCNRVLYKGSQKEQPPPWGLCHCSRWYLFGVIGMRHVHPMPVSACCHAIVYLTCRAGCSLFLVHLWSLSKPSGLFPVDQHQAVLPVLAPGSLKQLHVDHQFYLRLCNLSLGNMTIPNTTTLKMKTEITKSCTEKWILAMLFLAFWATMSWVNGCLMCLHQRNDWGRREEHAG